MKDLQRVFQETLSPVASCLGKKQLNIIGKYINEDMPMPWGH
jgi:hypothetical protein